MTSEIKDLLGYDPETGEFRWKVRRAQNALAGDLAGTKHSNGYWQIVVNYKAWWAHRLAWFLFYGELPLYEIDHVNGIRTDNRIINLRAVTHRENCLNTGMQQRNLSGCIGLSWDDKNNKWAARIGWMGKNIHLGRYLDWWDAVCARKSAEHRYGFHPNHGRIS